MKSKRDKGTEGEEVAVNYLLEKGYMLITRNFHTRFGEIDIIAKKELACYFFEVKFREKYSYGYGEASITSTKIKRLHKSLQIWISQHSEYQKHDFFLTALVIDDDQTVKEYEIM